MSSWVIEKTKALFTPVGGEISSKAGERIVDVVLDAFGGIFTFKAKFEHLKQDSARLSNVAFDVTTGVEKEELGGRKKRKREVEMWLKAESNIQEEVCAFVSNTYDGFMSRLTSISRIEKLNKRVKNLIEQRQNMDELVGDDPAPRGERLLMSKMCGAAFHEKVEQILNCLEDHKVHAIGIYGMAGVGKTAVAMSIYNLVLEKQDHVYWVSISENTSVRKLQDDISHVVGITLSGENDKSKRAAKLHGVLTQRKDLLLILDNLGENLDLEDVGCPLHVAGCQIIITSHSQRVCYQVGCQKTFEVKTLGEEDAWDLFRMVFGQDTAFSPGVEEIARSTVQMYSGLPQGIIKLGKRMKGVSGSSEWRDQLAEVEDFFEGRRR